MSVRELILQDLLERDLKSGETWSFAMYNELYSKLSSDDKAQWSAQIESLCNDGELETVINGAFSDYKLTAKGLESVKAMATRNVAEEIYTSLCLSEHSPGAVWPYEKSMELYSLLDPPYQKYWDKGLTKLNDDGIINITQTASGIRYSITETGSRTIEETILNDSKRCVALAEQAIKEGDYFTAADQYKNACLFNKSDPVLNALDAVGTLVCMARKIMTENGQITDSLKEFESANNFAYSVAGLLQSNLDKDIFSELKGSCSEAESVEAVKKVYYYVEGFLKSILFQLGMDFSNFNEDSTLRRTIALNRCGEFAVGYGDAIIDKWGDSMKDAAIEIWNHVLVDNPFGLSENDAKKIRMNSTHCKKYIDAIAGNASPVQAPEQKKESSSEAGIISNIKNRYSKLKKPVKVLIDIAAMMLFFGIGVNHNGILIHFVFYSLGLICLVMAVIHARKK